MNMSCKLSLTIQNSQNNCHERLRKDNEKKNSEAKENSDYLWQFYIRVVQFYINFLVWREYSNDSCDACLHCIFKLSLLLHKFMLQLYCFKGKL